MLTDNKLKSQIDALWNRLWSEGITNPFTDKTFYSPATICRYSSAGSAVAAKAKGSERELENLFQSLLQRYFG